MRNMNKVGPYIIPLYKEAARLTDLLYFFDAKEIILNLYHTIINQIFNY